jgi:hypothetical protein
MNKLKIYYVQQKATVWMQVGIEADSEIEAVELGLDSLRSGNGDEAEDSFEFQDEICLLDSEGTVIKLMEGENTN